MAQTATLHIKIDPKIAKALKSIAKKRRQTMGELVRQAVVTCYQPDLMGLTQKQQDAVSAYRAKDISIGKLAELMGLDIVTMRNWLVEHDIPQNTAYGTDDVANARGK